jgi:RND family efflux transporter MFP subunit
MQARALDEQQRQLTHESTRVTAMLDGGFVSPNEAEIKSAESAAKLSELLAEKAKLAGTSLEVSDCILRAPFTGEVATRSMDPGGFVRPGNAIVSVVDRSTVRMTADVPENDFDDVAPGKLVTVHIYATKKDIAGTITRRAPAADASTRTVHVEVDLPDPAKQIPVGTTGELRVDIGRPVAAVALPLSSATIRDTKAQVFTVSQNTAHAKTFTLLGESGGMLYAAPNDVAPKTWVVSEGRGLIKEGSQVDAKLEQPTQASADDAGPSETAALPAAAEEKAAP